ncbi:DUF2247 family protein [Nocardia sp. NPDC059177]|uniref:DUF2247 family protein n=1 Tax=Nocardia sp. NPDC059177 TaxID=3346759 RepID=UPI0036AAD557
MSDELLKFPLSAGFVTARAKVTPRELRYGFLNTWISAQDVVQLASSGIVYEAPPTEAVESLSLLLSDELDKVGDLIEQIVPDEKAVWVYLAVAWIIEHPADFGDEPFKAIELLYADFGYPTEMEPFIPFLPAPAGATPGLAGLEERVREYLAERWQYFWIGRGPEQLRGSV